MGASEPAALPRQGRGLCESPKIVPRVARRIGGSSRGRRDEWTNEGIEYEMGLVESTVKSLRSLVSQLSPNERHERLPAFVVCRTDVVAEIIKSHELDIATLTSLSSLEVLAENDATLAECAVDVVNEHLSVYLQLQGSLNAEAEHEKLIKRKGEIEKQQENLKQKMSASGYKQKVPAHVHEENVAKLEKLMQELEIVEEASQNLERIIAGDH